MGPIKTSIPTGGSTLTAMSFSGLAEGKRSPTSFEVLLLCGR